MARLELRSVNKQFGPTSVIESLDLTVEDQELLVLVGPSGCGKSTLLRLIAGLDQPTSGSIRLNDRDLVPLAPKDRDVAMVFQNYALYPHLSVFENLAFGLKRRNTQPLWERLLDWAGPISGYRSKEARYREEQVRRIAQILQMDQFLNRRPSELSGGQKQRVALGRAMVRNPQIYLMDEPLSNLDAQLRTQTRTQIVQWQRQLTTTTIYVTHDQTEAMTMGTRIAVLDRGRLQQVDTPLAVYQRPANTFVAGFIGEPQMNLIPMELQIQGGVAQLVCAGFRVALPQGYRAQDLPAHLILGVRPEQWILTPAPNNLVGVVDWIETLGSETLLGCTSPAGALRVRVSSVLILHPGDPITLGIEAALVHLFDRATGLRIKTIDPSSV